MAFSRELYIERSDFLEDPPRKFFRLGPDRKVRLKGAYIIHCTHFEKHENGEIDTIYAEYIPDSKSGEDTSGIKVKGTIHWVDKHTALNATVNQYDRLFMDPSPASHDDKSFLEFINPDSLHVVQGVKIEARYQDAGSGRHFQFLRKGYFFEDYDSKPDALVFNRTVTLRDTWARIQQKKQV